MLVALQRPELVSGTKSRAKLLRLGRTDMILRRM